MFPGWIYFVKWGNSVLVFQNGRISPCRYGAHLGFLQESVRTNLASGPLCIKWTNSYLWSWLRGSSLNVFTNGAYFNHCPFVQHIAIIMNEWLYDRDSIFIQRKGKPQSLSAEASSLLSEKETVIVIRNSQNCAGLFVDFYSNLHECTGISTRWN